MSEIDFRYYDITILSFFESFDQGTFHTNMSNSNCTLYRNPIESDTTFDDSPLPVLNE
jgi:hypothetical protein